MTKQKRAARLRKVVRGITGDIVIFITQVDPDAIGSAVGLEAILRKILDNTAWEGSIRIAYCGDVGHPQNLAVFNTFALFERFVRADELELTDDTVVMLVDSSRTNDSRLPECISAIDPILVIDHHRGEVLPAEGSDRMFWIEEVGAACTLVAELARTTQTSLSDADRIMMALGIFTDTKMLTATDDRDTDAFGWLTSSGTAEGLSKLIQFSLPPSHFDHLGHALTHREQRKSRVVAFAGVIRPEDGDVLSTIADDLLRQEGVSLVVAWGIVDGRIRISARSTDASISLNEFLKKRFGDREAGAKFAPDGRSEGGALIPLGIVWQMDDKLRALVIETWTLAIARLVFDDDE